MRRFIHESEFSPGGKAESIAGSSEAKAQDFGKWSECGLVKRVPTRTLGNVRKSMALIFTLALWMPAMRADDMAARVVVVANADDADSLRIAEYYVKQRHIPEANIIALSMPLTETISWREFVVGVWQPLQDELIRREWIDAIPMKLVDEVGRRKVAFSGHRISYLVLCRGVPLRINHDPALLTEVPGMKDRAEFNTNRSAVDSELSLLAYGPYNINAFVQSPLFKVKAPSDLLAGTIIKVSRLDGPSAADVMAVIDGSIEAETVGLIGRAYVDAKGPHAQGNHWMDAIAKEVEGLDFSLAINRQPGTFPAASRFDAPALYFGWYATNANGPFTLPGFRFAPGAVAVHIHSYSAHTLRSDRNGWCGPLIARGAAATTGAVFEPYLQLMHHLNLLLEALVRGETLGDAGYYALPVLSWQNVLIGDPLYRPFKQDLAAQWARHQDLPPRLGAYVTLRELQRLTKAGQTAEAEQLARREQRERPTLALGVALGQMLADKGDKTGAAQALGFAAYLRAVPVNEWGLLQSAAALLEQVGSLRPALDVYGNLLAQSAAPNDLRLIWMRQAARTASSAGDLQRAVRWEQEAAQLAGDDKKEGGPKSAP